MPNTLVPTDTGELALRFPRPLAQSVRTLAASFPDLAVVERCSWRTLWDLDLQIVGPKDSIAKLQMQIRALEEDYVSSDAW